MLGSLGWQELVLILAIVALLAGGSRVADLGGSLGRGVREFRQGLQDELPGDEPASDSAGDASDEAEASVARSSVSPDETRASDAG